MEKDNLSKSIFIILLLSLFIILVYISITKILKYDLFVQEKTVYVNIDKIIIPQKTVKNQDFSENDIKINNFVKPQLLGAKEYRYTPKSIDVANLNNLSKISFNELKEELFKNLDDSFDKTLSKNLIIANLLNLDEVKIYQQDARDLLNAKLIENSKYKEKTYLYYITANEHLELMNTSENRYKASKNFAQYMANRNAYLNYFYLYESNVERFKQQETKKVQKEVIENFQDYKKNQIDQISANIVNSQRLTKKVISNIEINKKNQKFIFNPIKDINKNKISPLKLDDNKSVDTDSLNKIDKEKIIKQIASDHNVIVTFNKTDKTEDYTNKIQYYIDKFSYLYIM